MDSVESCARQLRNQILGGEISVGARLPAERALAESFGVNRVTVRGALARLEAEGLVDVRQGSGYTVRRWQRTAGPELVATLADLARDAKGRRHLFADLLLVRRQLARAILEQLVEREIAEADLLAIERAVDSLAEAAERGATIDEIANADLEVAGAVVDATKSTVLALCMNPVAQVLVAVPALQKAMFRQPAHNVAAWRVLVAWMRGARSRAGLARIVEALEERDDRTMKELSR